MRLSCSVSGLGQLGEHLYPRAETRGHLLEFGHLFFAEFEPLYAIVDRVSAQLDRHVLQNCWCWVDKLDNGSMCRGGNCWCWVDKLGKRVGAPQETAGAGATRSITGAGAAQGTAGTGATSSSTGAGRARSISTGNTLIASVDAHIRGPDSAGRGDSTSITSTVSAKHTRRTGAAPKLSEVFGVLTRTLESQRFSRTATVESRLCFARPAPEKTCTTWTTGTGGSRRPVTGGGSRTRSHVQKTHTRSQVRMPHIRSLVLTLCTRQDHECGGRLRHRSV